MIKKIKIENLRIGMFIHDLDIDWMDHPFFKNSFKLTSDSAVEKIKNLKIREVYIDTDKGVDVLDKNNEQEKNLAEIQQEVKKTMEDLIKPYPIKEMKFSAKEEWPQAIKINYEANQIINNMMDDVRLGKQIEIERLNPVVEKIVKSIFNNKDALLGVVRIREMDKYTFEHSVSVAVLLTSFCKYLAISNDIIRQVAIGGLLHDIGKAKIPLNILNKPGRLNEDEFIIMRRHVDYSREILVSLNNLSDISYNIIYEHHERYDGSGYPKGKNFNDISFYGKIAAIIDVYDALTSDRCYHKGQTPHQVLGKLIEWSKYHFDPELVQHFIRCVGIYPVGTLVVLQSGRLGVIIESNEGDLLRPTVKLVYDKNKNCNILPLELNLSKQINEPFDKIIGSDNPEKYKLNIDQILKPN